MEFQTAEVIFYASTVAAGSLGGFSRQLRDGARSSWKRNVGRIFAGGVFAFGGVGLWVGDTASSFTAFPWYLVAASTFIGFYASELHELLEPLMKKIVLSVLKKFGIEPDEE